MKYITKFKLFETGEWSSDVDWDYIKKNPDDKCAEAQMIKYLENQLDIISENLIDPKILEIIDIRGFDLNFGPYAMVKIFNRNYKIWILDDNDNSLFIENFPINTNEGHDAATIGVLGYEGNTWDIEMMLNNITEAGGIELYLISQKYNL